MTTLLIHIKRKHSTSLQNYLNELNKASEEDVDPDWGFFIDLEHDNRTKSFRKERKERKEIEIQSHHHYHHHYHHHHHYDDKSESDSESESESESILTKATKMTNVGNALVIIGFIAYLILI